jgi:arsenite methyltransferase
MQKPKYGIDAPDLLITFFTTGIVSSILLMALYTSSLVDGILKPIACFLLAIVSFYLLGMGCLMLFFSKVQKLKDREKLLDLIQWSGSELVLDVGCGRGLMLIGVAKRLTGGKAIGIDLWQQQDQASNSLEAALANAEIEKVSEHIEVKTADMRHIPFPENYFDVVVSSWAVHNIEVEVERQKALDEIIRVLKPGGSVVLQDIVNQSEYANHFQHRGLIDVQLHKNPIQDMVLKAITFGSFAPSAVSATKPD